MERQRGNYGTGRRRNKSEKKAYEKIDPKIFYGKMQHSKAHRGHDNSVETAETSIFTQNHAAEEKFFAKSGDYYERKDYFHLACTFCCTGKILIEINRGGHIARICEIEEFYKQGTAYENHGGEKQKHKVWAASGHKVHGFCKLSAF